MNDLICVLPPEHTIFWNTVVPGVSRPVPLGLGVVACLPSSSELLLEWITLLYPVLVPECRKDIEPDGYRLPISECIVFPNRRVNVAGTGRNLFMSFQTATYQPLIQQILLTDASVGSGSVLNAGFCCGKRKAKELVSTGQHS